MLISLFAVEFIIIFFLYFILLIFLYYFYFFFLFFYFFFFFLYFFVFHNSIPFHLLFVLGLFVLFCIKDFKYDMLVKNVTINNWFFFLLLLHLLLLHTSDATLPGWHHAINQRLVTSAVLSLVLYNLSSPKPSMYS